MSPSGSHTRISAGGGTEPIWNPQGGERFHRVRHRLVSTTLTFDSEPRVVRRVTLPFRLSGAEMAAGANYDVSRNGQRFLTVRSAVANDQPIVVTGWLDEVRKLIAPR